MANSRGFDLLRDVTPTVSVGVLTANLLALGSEIALLERTGAKLAHVDVMDGCYCPMMTVGPPFIKAIKTSLLKDVHLMIDEPLEKVAEYVAAGADIITIHPEACSQVHRVLQKLRTLTNANDPQRGVVRGIALNPGTPLEVLDPLLDEIEMVSLLAVNPGWGGQKYIPATNGRIARVQRIIAESGKDIILCVDGGITKENIAEIAATGADLIVAGSAVFDGKTPEANAHFMLEAVEKGVRSQDSRVRVQNSVASGEPIGEPQVPTRRETMSGQIELLIGCDFGAPLAAGDQSKKNIVIEASRKGNRCYEIAATGRNERLVRKVDPTGRWTDNRRGWSIPDLARSIREDRLRLTVAAFDLPFSIPLYLLESAAFAGKVAEGVFHTRANWAHFVEQHVGLAFASDKAGAKLRLDPILCGWKDKHFWIRRATDVATKAQPALMHTGLNLFNMTVVGSKFLGSLRDGGMEILLRPEERGRRLGGSVIETFPRAVARAVGFEGSYKQKPEGCLEAAEGYLRQQRIALDFDREVRKFCVEYRTHRKDPDGADAFLCLVTAICIREGLAEWHKGDGTAEKLDEEGCIVTPVKLSPGNPDRVNGRNK